MIIGDLQNGIVIDHIPDGKGKALYHYLGLGKLSCQVALIEHADSQKHGKKDILKINQPMDLDFDLLGYFDPAITIDIIRDGHVSEKVHPKLPDQLVDILKCNNPRCITSIEQELHQVFRLTDPETKTYRCVYCDTIGKAVEE